MNSDVYNILRVAKKGNIIGNLTDLPRVPYEAIAKTDVVLERVCPETDELLRACQEEVRCAFERQTLLSGRDIQKTAACILMMCDLLGLNEHKEVLLWRDVIAGYASMAKESVSRSVKHLVDQKVLERCADVKSVKILNPSALSELAAPLRLSEPGDLFSLVA